MTARVISITRARSYRKVATVDGEAVEEKVMHFLTEQARRGKDVDEMTLPRFQYEALVRHLASRFPERAPVDIPDSLRLAAPGGMVTITPWGNR
jgi:hypothetical protein